MKQIYFFLLIALIHNSIIPQASWKTLPNAPTANRHDDIYFINEKVGWTANGRGQIWRTADGGTAWTKQFDNPTIYFRSIGFADSLHGWAGNLGTDEFGGQTDTNIIYATTDGGTTWKAQTNFLGIKPRGVCGISVVNDSVVYAVGRVRGPSFFLFTKNGGKTWATVDMSFYIAGMVDVKFFSEDSGFVCGMSDVNHANSSGRILFTSDGGFTWETKYTSSRAGEWAWKISFPSRNVGYVSLQRNTGAPVNFLKTTDGGITWQEKLLSTTAYYVQGIGFATDSLGWVGGSSTLAPKETTDGGETWHTLNFGSRVNRIRKVHDSLLFASGTTLYKYSSPHQSTAIKDLFLPESFSLEQNFPNPFNYSTKIKFTVPFFVEPNDFVKLAVYDLLGNKVIDLVEEIKEPGNYTVIFDAKELPSGVYLYRIESKDFSAVRKAVLLK